MSGGCWSWSCWSSSWRGSWPGPRPRRPGSRHCPRGGSSIPGTRCQRVAHRHPTNSSIQQKSCTPIHSPSPHTYSPPPHDHDLTSPLSDLTSKGASDPVQWMEQCQLVLEKVKQALCGDSVLHKPNFSLPFMLQTDASNSGLGAILSQQVRGVDHRCFTAARGKRESRYSMVEKDCLALWWAVGGWHSVVLPTGAAIHPLFRPCSPPVPPSHERYQGPVQSDP